MNDNLIKEIDSLEEQVKEKKEEIKGLNAEISYMKKKINKVHERISVLNYLKPDQFYKYFRKGMVMKKKEKKKRRDYNKIPPTFKEEWDTIRTLINPNANRGR